MDGGPIELPNPELITPKNGWFTYRPNVSELLQETASQNPKLFIPHNTASKETTYSVNMIQLANIFNSLDENTKKTILNNISDTMVHQLQPIYAQTNILYNSRKHQKDPEHTPDETHRAELTTKIATYLENIVLIKSFQKSLGNPVQVLTEIINQAELYPIDDPSSWLAGRLEYLNDVEQTINQIISQRT